MARALAVVSTANVYVPTRGGFVPLVTQPSSGTVPSQIIAYTTQGGSSDFSTSKELDCTGASLIILFGFQTAAAYGDEAVFSDSESNTWTQLDWSNSVSGAIIGYKVSPTTSATQTFTFGGSVPTDPVAGVIALTGFGTLDTSNQADSDSPGSITTTTDGDFVVCVAGTGTEPSTVTVNAGLSKLAGTWYSGQTKGIYVADTVQATAGSLDATWSGLTSPQTAIAAFKPVTA